MLCYDVINVIILFHDAHLTVAGKALLHSMQVEAEGTDGEEVTLLLPTDTEAHQLVAQAVKAERQLIGEQTHEVAEGSLFNGECVHLEKYSLNKAVASLVMCWRRMDGW